MPRLLILDNYDSFTFNLVYYLEAILEAEVDVLRNDEITIEEVDKYDRIVLSPGPGLPEEAGILIPLIKTYRAKKAILGVCLGHQALSIAFGGDLLQLDEVMHGLQRKCIVQGNDAFFKGVENIFDAGRYHSWVVNEKSLAPEFNIIARDEQQNIMAMSHKDWRLYGVQFHPESIMTPQGKLILENWLSITS